MARSMNVKPFYLGLVAIALIGAGGIWLARDGDAGAPIPAPVPVGSGEVRGYVLGSHTAPVEVIEFSDFQCPVCARFTILTMPDVQRELIETGRVRWVFRDFPLPSHPNAEVAHLAAACADEQGRFWPMHDQLYLNQGRWTGERRPERMFREYARAVGLDLERYDACMSERRYAGRIQASRNGGAALGVNATPTFVIDGMLHPGWRSYDSLATLVRRAEAVARQ